MAVGEKEIMPPIQMSINWTGLTSLVAFYAVTSFPFIIWYYLIVADIGNLQSLYDHYYPTFVPMIIRAWFSPTIFLHMLVTWFLATSVLLMVINASYCELAGIERKDCVILWGRAVQFAAPQ